jgi:hypothetical protein
MVSSGLLRRVALVRTTRRNNREDIILHDLRLSVGKEFRADHHGLFGTGFIKVSGKSGDKNKDNFEVSKLSN